MRRMARILLSITAVLTLSISTLVGSAMPVVAANASGDPEGDIAKMYRVKHELKFDMKGTSATLDGKAVHADKPILKDGRVFVPLRTLQESGAAASISWDAKKMEAQIVMKPQIAPNWQKLSFRIGSDQIYLPDGEAIAGEKIPKPFLANGRTYIPVKPLSWLGVAASLNEGTVTWNWSEKIIEVMTRAGRQVGRRLHFRCCIRKTCMRPSFYTLLAAGDGEAVRGLSRQRE
ncbi:hypothetical protein D3C77_450860 [compost metagenome]